MQIADDRSVPLTSFPKKISWFSFWLASRKNQIIIVAFTLLFVAASMARLATFERYLPFIDNYDEPPHYILPRVSLGIEQDAKIVTLLQGYPPFYNEVNLIVQKIVEFLPHKAWIGPADYFFALRLTSALVGIITTIFVAVVGWQIGGPVAGWFAGLIWGLAPIVLENNSYALPDPFVYLGTAAALAFALYALQKEKPAWLIPSFIAALIAIFSKYTAVGTLVPGAIVSLVLLRKNKKAMIRWGIVSFFLVGGAAFYLVFIYGAFKLDIYESRALSSTGLAIVLNPIRDWHDLQGALFAINGLFFAIVVLLSIPFYFYTRTTNSTSGQNVQRNDPIKLGQIILVLIPFSIVTLLMASSATEITAPDGKMRHVLPLTISLAAIWGAAVAQIGIGIAKAAQRFKLNSRLLHGFALALIGVVAITPMATGLSNTIHLFSLTNIHVALWRWTDTNIPLDGRIMLLSNGEIENTWSRNWSGYDGVKSFQWWYIDDDLTPSTPQIYSDRGITYLAVTDKDLTKSFMVRPDVVALLKQLVLIKTIPGAPQNSGPTVYFYRMLPPQHSVNANFGGEISLIGYDLNHDTFNPGDTVHFRPYWRSLQRPRSNYSIFVHMVPENVVTTVAQYDGPPTTESRPTLTWDDTAELYIGSDDTFTIPPGTAPGNYMLQIGLYDYNTGQRLKISDSADSFTIPLVVQ